MHLILSCTHVYWPMEEYILVSSGHSINPIGEEEIITLLNIFQDQSES